MAVTHGAERRVELGHLAQTAVRQTEPHRRDVGGDGLGHHHLVGGPGQRASDEGDLLERGHPQTVLLGGGEPQPLEQVIHQAAAAMHQHQGSVLLVEKGLEGGKQGGQRLVVFDQCAAQLDYQSLLVHRCDPSLSP